MKKILTILLFLFPFFCHSSTNTGSTTVSHSFNSNPAMGTLLSTAVRPNIMLELSQQPSNDAGIVSIDSVRGACPGNVDVYATVKNFGINPITTLQIDWKIDGVLQIPFNYSGNLAPADTSQIFLGTSLFVAGIGQTFDVWTSNPNGVTDTTTVNDTLTIAGLMPGLNGTYTIGSVSADFSSFNSAVDALVNNGACGPVEFTVNPGTYLERVIIHEIPNASSINNITFRSVANDSSSVILEWPSSTTPDSNYTLLLYGVKHITFHGITFSRTGTNANCTVVEMDNGSGEVNFYNNRFIGPDNMSTANTSGSQSGIFNQGGSQWSVVTIRKNCLFTTGTTLGFFGTAQSTLANLQAASLMDSNSVNANPNFLTFNDLHTVAGPLADAGSGLALIESDIDGESRDLGHPDIGADEFSSVGITDINLDEGIKIYPNPANENLFVDLIFENIHGLFTVIDITGREVLHQKLNLNKNVVDVSGLLEGFYLLKMELDGRVLVKKFVVRR